LPASLASNTWHTVITTVSGSTLTVSLDSQKVATLDSASFPSGAGTYPIGAVGLREYNGEEAQFRNLKVVGSSGETVYSNPLSNTSALGDFNVPGTNALPSILDGAARDRAVWSGDLNVEGPATYYSTGNSAYLKGALQLLGSYQLSRGSVAGAMPPGTSLHTGLSHW